MQSKSSETTPEKKKKTYPSQLALACLQRSHLQQCTIPVAASVLGMPFGNPVLYPDLLGVKMVMFHLEFHLVKDKKLDDFKSSEEVHVKHSCWYR